MKFVRNSIIYTAVSVIQKAFSFLLLVVYTKFMPTTDYGIVSLVTAMAQVVMVLMTLGLNAAITRFYYEVRDDPAKVKELFGTIVYFTLIVSTVMTLVLFAFHRWLLLPLVRDIDFFPFILLGLISAFFMPLYQMYQTVLQTREQGILFAINSLAFFFLNMALALVLVVVMRMKAVGVLAALAVSNGVLFVWAFISFIPQMSTVIRRDVLVIALKYSLPLLPHMLSGWIIMMVDRFFLNNLRGNTSVGLYTTGFQFGFILSIVTASINQAFVPWFFAKMKEGLDGRKKIVRAAECLAAMIALMGLGIGLFGKEVIGFMVARSYREAWVVVPFISSSCVFGGLYYFFVNPLSYAVRGTKYLSLATIISAAASIVLNLILIPVAGTVGSALSNLGSNIIISILVFIMMRLIEPINYRWGRMYLFAFGGLILSCAAFLNSWLDPLPFALLRITLFIGSAIFILAAYRTDFSIMKNLLLKRSMA